MIGTMCKNRGIGLNNNLPWPTCKNEMMYMSHKINATKKSVVIMGNNTYLSILNSANRPVLSEHTNFVISSTEGPLDNRIKNARTFSNINLAISHCYIGKFDTVWIIGGGKLYESMLNNKLIYMSELYLTYIDKEYDCDTFFPEIPYDFKEKMLLGHVKENGVNVYFAKFSH